MPFALGSKEPLAHFGPLESSKHSASFIESLFQELFDLEPAVHELVLTEIIIKTKRKIYATFAVPNHAGSYDVT